MKLRLIARHLPQFSMPKDFVDPHLGALALVGKSGAAIEGLLHHTARFVRSLEYLHLDRLESKVADLAEITRTLSCPSN